MRLRPTAYLASCTLSALGNSIAAIADVPGNTARDALHPGIIRHGTVSAERITGARETSAAVAILVGPAAAGVLVRVWGGTTSRPAPSSEAASLRPRHGGLAALFEQSLPRRRSE